MEAIGEFGYYMRDWWLLNPEYRCVHTQDTHVYMHAQLPAKYTPSTMPGCGRRLSGRPRGGAVRAGARDEQREHGL